MAKTDLTAARLRDVLHYSPDSGVFIWLKSRLRTDLIGRQAGCVSRCRGYVEINVDQRLYGAHRLAWLYVHGVWPKNIIDHIDGDRTNNRLCNLREATRAQNTQNIKRARTDSQSGMLGVTWSPRHKKWVAQIMAEGRQRHLGLFESCDAASVAYLDAKRKLHPFNTI